MTHQEVLQIADAHLLPEIIRLYGLEGCQTKAIPAHEGGRNAVFTCEKEGAGAKILRIAYLNDRTRGDLLAEAEYVRYLYENGGCVANVISSKQGNLLEEIVFQNHTYFVLVFEMAKGKLLAENNYRYREGAPLTEYFYNCGKVLGKMHQLSKAYDPVHLRYSFFEKYNDETIQRLLPPSLSLLKEKLKKLIENLKDLDRSREAYGMVHFDYSDGNYMIDFETGKITVFDFDNACFCFYMYDLANLYTHGVGWTQFEKDPGKRKQFMEEYFQTVLDGYRSETAIDQAMLTHLPLFIQAVQMEGVIDAFEVMQNSGEEPVCDGELSYLIKCLEDDIPYMGFYHEMYSSDEPFEWEERDL